MMSNETKQEQRREFPHLRMPPIVEAVIRWQCQANANWEAAQLTAELSVLLPDYPIVNKSHLKEFLFAASMDEDKLPVADRRDTWFGLRLQAGETGPYIAQFLKNGLIFSRLEPYENWELFASEGLRLWNIFQKVAEPTEIQLLGVRFINRIRTVNAANLSVCLKEPPTFVKDFPLREFTYQSRFRVPGEELEISVTKSIPAAIDEQPSESGLIIDIDVYTTAPIAIEALKLSELLPKMRKLKNKMFFGLLTSDAITELEQE